MNANKISHRMQLPASKQLYVRYHSVFEKTCATSQKT